MRHIIEDKTGKTIVVHLNGNDTPSSYFSLILKLGEDRLGQCAGHGICGKCRFQLKNGVTDKVQNSLHDDLISDGQQLACCSAPAPESDTHIIFDDFEFKSR